MARFPGVSCDSRRRAWTRAGVCVVSWALAAAVAWAELPVALDPPPAPPAALMTSAGFPETGAVAGHVDDRSAGPEGRHGFDESRAMGGNVSDWFVPGKLPHGPGMKVVAVAQLAPQRDAKPGDEPRPAELTDLSQVGRRCTVAAVLSAREAQELDARSIARNLLASGQIPPGLRLVRVAKVRFAGQSAEGEPPAAKPDPADAPEVARDGAAPPAAEQPLKHDRFRPITAMTVETAIQKASVALTPDADMGEKKSARVLFGMAETKEEYPHVGDVWLDEGFFLEAARFCHQPLYFEEVNLERFGTTRHPLLQPVISGARFFATVPALPYLMTIDRPSCCQYDGSPYLAGRPAPWHKELPPLRFDALTVEALVATGAVFVLP